MDNKNTFSFNTCNGLWSQLANVTKYVFEDSKIVFKTTYNYFFNSQKYTEYTMKNVRFFFRYV